MELRIREMFDISKMKRSMLRSHPADTRERLILIIDL